LLTGAQYIESVHELDTHIPQDVSDIAGGFVATLPSERELSNPRVAPFVRRFYQTGPQVDPVDRIKLGRLVENMTGATAIVECLHGAGSPQAQRVVLQRRLDWEAGKRLAARLARLGGEQPDTGSRETEDLI